VNSAADWNWPFQCEGCARAYPSSGFHYRCQHCGSPFGLLDDALVEEINSIGIDRNRATFPLPPQAEFISLGEGNTALVPEEIKQRQIFFKCEHFNPTGSFKDRGTALLVSVLKFMDFHQAIEDSSGNAGASFAAYAAAAGIRAKIFIPAYASGLKRKQIEAYGACVVPIKGRRSAATKAAHLAIEGGEPYASHAHLPHVHAGLASIAFELLDDLGAAPGAIILPVGQGTLLLGLDYGFRWLRRHGKIKQLPRLIAVQAQACAPLWDSLNDETEATQRIEGITIAEGIRISHPIREHKIVAAIQHSKGEVVAVDEQGIKAGRDALGARGFFVEPTSAVVWPAILETLPRLADPVVAILTGSGFKSA